MEMKNDSSGRTLLITSLIDIDLWNEAGWFAVAFQTDPRSTSLPRLALVFSSEAAARKIFAGWRDRLGSLDLDELLRISVVEGDIPGAFPGYTVHLGLDIERYAGSLAKQGKEMDSLSFLNFSRFHRMNTGGSRSENLERFKKSFLQFKRFELLPAWIASGNVELGEDLAIEKTAITFKTVEEIVDPDDIDQIVLGKEVGPKPGPGATVH